jgi:5-methylcytosine-specific restriction protein B
MIGSITDHPEDQVKSSRPLEVVLTQGALDNGYIRVPSDQQLFQSDFIANSEDQSERLFDLVLPNGEVRQTCVLGRHNRIQARFYALFSQLDLKPGDKSVLTSDDNDSSRFYLTFIQQMPGSEPAPNFIEENNKTMTTPPLNQILFGPPGTGKTYSTIDAALEIIDPEFLASHPETPHADWAVQCVRREALKQRFDALSKKGQIRFVTFHQSFSYEDFVEGIRASPSSEEDEQDSGSIQYKVEKGVFGQLCEDAQRNKVYEEQIGVRDNAKVWKISIEEANSSGETRQYCLKHGEARIGWSNVKNIRTANLADPDFKLGTNEQSSLANFGRDIVPGDVLVCLKTKSQICAVGIVTGEYEYTEQVPDGVRSDYVHKLPVKWLATDLKFDITELNQGIELTQKMVYLLWRIKWPALQEALHRANVVLAGETSVPAPSTEPYVLIIDEINRGNVSRIFGELITLIEPSKRANAEEALDTLLPYSKQPFSVPSNVYLIGTMNTADRSLAGLDIALRRRFTFKEMPPKPELLRHINVEGVNIERILRVMNERIEVLLDRDHCLGHAYFMSLKTNDPLEELAFIFLQKILPLLQEYFFEDWERIAWILNDHNKSPEHQFVKRKSSSLESLFGSRVAGNLQDRRWHIDESAFYHIESYRGILGANV